MNKVFPILFCCGIAFLFVVAGGWGLAEEAPKKPVIKDTRILKLPKKGPATTDQQQQQPQPAAQNPEVVSVETLPPLADCKARWKVTVKNPNNAPFDKPVTIHVKQYHVMGPGNWVTYNLKDGVIVPNPIPAGKTGTAIGEFFGRISENTFLTTYSLEVKSGGLQIFNENGVHNTVFADSVAISDCRLQQATCYVTLKNEKAHQACSLRMDIAYGKSASPSTWDHYTSFDNVDVPPNGSVERSFARVSGYDRIKVNVKMVRKHATTGAINVLNVTEKIIPVP